MQGKQFFLKKTPLQLKFSLQRDCLPLLQLLLKRSERKLYIFCPGFLRMTPRIWDYSCFALLLCPTILSTLGDKRQTFSSWQPSSFLAQPDPKQMAEIRMGLPKADPEPWDTIPNKKWKWNNEMKWNEREATIIVFLCIKIYGSLYIQYTQKDTHTNTQTYILTYSLP